MERICKQSGKQFFVTDEDIKFYEKMNVPVPTLCPEERQRRRLSWRNERTLYQRKCDLCGKGMISLYREDSKHKVYCQQCWWSDKWDRYEFGRDLDFSRGFFEQFGELLKDVPMFGLVNVYSTLQNSDYTNYVTDAKNCYLVFAANYLEDVMYSSYIWESKDCLDCCYSTKLELCYDCIDCDALYNCRELRNSKNCRDCMLGFGLSGCKNCFGCVNLVNKEYHFYNEQLSKEEYEVKVTNILTNAGRFEEERRKFDDFSLKFPKRFAHLINCENSTGNGLKNCKNCQDCFEGYGGEDLKYMINFPGGVKDCYDISGCAQLELAVDSAILVPGYNIKYSNCVLNGGSNITLSAFIDGGNDLFGCVGLSKAKYCILNRQYSREEYEKLVPLIIKKMTADGEWGEFFPMKLSPFAYNETVAHEYYLMEEMEARERGLMWQGIDKKEYLPSTVVIPDDIALVKDDFVNELLACERCGRNYKINLRELNFYRRQKISLPRKCHQCRHEERLARRPGFKLWDGKCDNCGKDIKTTYSPDRPEKVYCEKCYLEKVY